MPLICEIIVAVGLGRRFPGWAFKSVGPRKGGGSLSVDARAVEPKISCKKCSGEVGVGGIWEVWAVVIGGNIGAVPPFICSLDPFLGGDVAFSMF